MGLLDDAIRDHLELKRRHGADPGEVSRIESEALSPAKREAPAPAEEPDEALGEVDLEDDPLADLPYRDAEPDDDAYEPEHVEAPVHHHEPEPEAVYEVEPEELEREAREEDPQATQQFSLEELEEQGRRDAEIPGQPRPREPQPGAAAEPPAEGDEDVLEETPEFLQETPEHDRLWFEQKPPKDFDF